MDEFRPETPADSNSLQSSSRRKVAVKTAPGVTFLNFSYRAPRGGMDLADMNIQSPHLNKRFVKSFLQKENTTKTGRTCEQLARIEAEMDKYYSQMDNYKYS